MPVSDINTGTGFGTNRRVPACRGTYTTKLETSCLGQEQSAESNCERQPSEGIGVKKGIKSKVISRGKPNRLDMVAVQDSQIIQDPRI